MSMMGRSLTRIRAMDLTEILWRSRSAARTAVDRARVAAARPTWNRRDLAGRLASGPALSAARAALGRGRWLDAHNELARHFVAAPQRFVIAPGLKSSLADSIRREFPDSADGAVERADRLVAGDYDLLGYRGLRFDSPIDRSGTSGRINWHYDPVHDRQAPRRFWSEVPYLDQACGDHKIIWELNRHQHWLALGRAFWLTNDPRYRLTCIGELESWLDDNPPLVGINWASMLELALRSISWVWALHLFADPAVTEPTPWIVDLLLGLDEQLAHVERNISYYFSPNTHLLGEALALYVAGRSLPELAASPRREALGRQLLVRELGKQVAADGGHRERSTHYHKYTLDFYLLALAIARITGDRVVSDLEPAAASLAFAARLLADGRGCLPHIGDDDGGVLTPLTGRAPDDVRDSLSIAAALVGLPELRVGPPPEEAFWLLAQPTLAASLDRSREAPVSGPLASAALPDTGYHVSRSASGDHLVIDGGPHGYQNAGHAHADALSVTFARHGVPLLIDTGTGCYTVDPAMRDRFRSTALHNTLLVDDRPQSIPRGPFHWAHTAQGTANRWRTNCAFDYFDGVHDGYTPVEHRRHVLALHDDLLVVADLVSGEGCHRAAVHWHIDPRWQVELRGRRAVHLTTESDRVDLFVSTGTTEVVCGDREGGLGWYSPVYGRVDPAPTIRVTHEGAAPLWMISVFGLSLDNAIGSVEVVPVWAEAGLLAHSVGVRIGRAESTDYLVIAEPVRATPATWRVGDLETDARMLFCQTRDDRSVTRLALVDGSIVRAGGRSGLHLLLPRQAPDLHLDMADGTPDRPELGEVARTLSGPPSTGGPDKARPTSRNRN